MYLKLHPETTKEEYDQLWEKIDENSDGNLDQQELAHFFGVNYADLAKDMRDKRASEKAMEEMDDDQILEALQVTPPSLCRTRALFSRLVLAPAGQPPPAPDGLAARVRWCADGAGAARPAGAGRQVARRVARAEAAGAEEPRQAQLAR